MRAFPRNLLLSAAATLATTSLWGQKPAPRREVDLAVTYSAERSNITPGQFFWRQGGTAEAAVSLYHGFGAALDLNGSHAGNIQGTSIDLNTFTTTVGPRYTWTKKEKLSVFGQALFGESHAWNSSFPQAGGSTSSANSFALQFGGGVDLTLRKRLAIRAIQADWVRTQFPNATTNVQNNLRLGAGLVLRLHPF